MTSTCSCNLGAEKSTSPSVAPGPYLHTCTKFTAKFTAQESSSAKKVHEHGSNRQVGRSDGVSRPLLVVRLAVIAVGGGLR